MVADVLVELKAKEIDQTFTYQIPSNLLDKVENGKRVLVPFRKQKLEGFILDIGNKKADTPINSYLPILIIY